MKKLWKKVRRASPSSRRSSGDASPKLGSTRGSVASLNVGYEVREKDLGKLHKAAWIGDLNKVKQLAKKDPSPLDKENRTPLHLACVQGNEQVVQELLEWKAKTNIGDNQTRTPLMRAVEFQQEGCVALLLSSRVDIDSGDGQGNTPLHIGVQCGGSLNIISMLIKAGASLNTKNKEGYAPLHLAVRAKLDDVCRLLLKERADVNVEDTNLRTPLMYACQDGSVSLVKLLLTFNADTNHKDSKGWSADDCAVIPGHHACSQLITDNTHRLSRTTPSSTPRSSLPPSVANTPRDKDSIGLPVQDGGGDDSDNETLSKASGGPDSWADSPEISVMDDKKGKEESDVDDDIFDEQSNAPKVSLAKFAKNLHISESDTDGESVRGPAPKVKSSTVDDKGAEQDAINDDNRTAPPAANVASVRQTSWQSQTSGEENSWGDSPLTPRKMSAQRVSFKRDEELSEIHDITVTESEAESDIHDHHHHEGRKATPGALSTPKKTNGTSGYIPSSSTPAASVSPSAEKMRGDSKPALMDELGISDAEDISDVSDESIPKPILPSSPPPTTPAQPRLATDSEWDSSVISDIMNTPRQGILKNRSNDSVDGTMNQEQQSGAQPKFQPAKQHSPKTLLKVPAIDSGDESSAWDTTEAENIAPVLRPVKISQQVPVAAGAPPQRDSVSEWDSDLEDMITPMVPASGKTPTPPIHPPTATITKEVEAIVRQKQAECQDSEDEGSVSPVGKDGPPTPLVSETIGQSAKFHVGSSSSNDSSNNDPVPQNKNEEEEDDDWDSTNDAITPRANAFLQYTEVNVGAPSSLSEPVVAVKSSVGVNRPIEVISPETQVAGGSGGMLEKDDEDTESAWDSEDDVGLPSTGPSHVINSGPVPVSSSGVTSPRRGQGQGGANSEKESSGRGQLKAVDSDEDTETISSWEVERLKDKKSSFLAAANSGQTVIDRLGSPDAELDAEDEARSSVQEILSAQLVEQQQRARQIEEEEEERKRKEEEERIDKEKREREESDRKREEQRREWEREEARKQEELQLQWEREEAEKKEQLRMEVEEMMKKEEDEKIQAQNLNSGKLLDEDNTFIAQQHELNRIDEQFQRERMEREMREEEMAQRRKDEDELMQKRKEENDKTIQMASQVTHSTQSHPAVPLSKPISPVVKPTGASSSSGIYVNISNSTVEQIKQRLQVPPPTAATSVSPSFPTDGFDDDDSFTSDNPGDERPSLPQTYLQGLMGPSPGLYRPNDPLDDDALSYTSTEFEDPVQSSAVYGRDREMLANINISDPSSLLKVQEHVRDVRRNLEQEKNHRAVLENKLKVITKEKAELSKKLDTLSQHKSSIEQTMLDLEAKIRSLEYGMTEEEEKRKNAEILLSKTKEQLARKEAQFSSELEAKQRAELTMRNLQIEMRTAANTIKELEEEKEELQRQATHATNARLLQEQINDDQQKFMQQQQQQQQQQHTPRETDGLDVSLEASGESNKAKAELYALKMEMDRQRSRFKDEVTLMGAENEELLGRVEELRNDIKLNEEALAHATMQYNLQAASMRTEIGNITALLEKERAARDKVEAEIESLKTRLLAASQEMDKAIRARNELEREHRREKDTWVREMERKEEEVNMLKDNSQHLNQRLHVMDSKFSAAENELHVSSTSLMERTNQLQQLRQELDRSKASQETADQNYRVEKEHMTKLQAKVENMQEKLTQQQHENLSLRQQMDSLKVSAGGLPGSDANEKLNNILTNLRADSDRAKASLEERNSTLVEQVARLKEEVRGAETRRTSLEQELRRLNEEHNDLVKKFSHAEASLQMTLRSKEQLEQDRAQLRLEVEKLQQRYQAAHDKSVEAQARMSEMVDRLERAENTSMHSSRQLADTSANMQAVAKTKSELDESLQLLQVENARLDAELKSEKRRADMLYQDLQDSQKVRNSLEALCANFKSNSTQLEDKLGSEENECDDSRLDRETAARVVFEAEARDHKALWDQEIQSRSKLGLRIADLEKIKQVSESQLTEVKNRSNLANEEKRTLENRLEQEMDKNQQLQKDMNTLKLHLKSAKNKIKMGESPRADPHYTEFRRDVDNMTTHVSTPRAQNYHSDINHSHPLLRDILAMRDSVNKMNHSRRKMESEIKFLEAQVTDPGGDIRNELEVKYRMELNRKLEDVNRFLDSQTFARDRLDTSRTEVEAHLLADKRKLEEENNNLRVKFEQALSQRENKEMEAKRFRELYESEMKWRMRISDQLQLATDKGVNLKSKFNAERYHRNRLTNSIGNLNSSLMTHNSFDAGHANGFHDDELSNKIKAELDRSIAKHLEAAPHNHHKPILRQTKDETRFNTSLTQASNDYFDLLKRKYRV